MRNHYIIDHRESTSVMYTPTHSHPFNTIFLSLSLKKTNNNLYCNLDLKFCTQIIGYLESGTSVANKP